MESEQERGSALPLEEITVTNSWLGRLLLFSAHEEKKCV